MFTFCSEIELGSALSNENWAILRDLLDQVATNDEEVLCLERGPSKVYNSFFVVVYCLLGNQEHLPRVAYAVMQCVMGLEALRSPAVTGSACWNEGWCLDMLLPGWWCEGPTVALEWLWASLRVFWNWNQNSGQLCSPREKIAMPIQIHHSLDDLLDFLSCVRNMNT